MNFIRPHKLFLILGLLAFVSPKLTLAQSTNCVPAPPGLVSWWRGENDALDFLGGNQGVIAGNVGYVPGPVGQAFDFNGTDAYVKIPASSNLNVAASGSFSVELWINPVTLATPQPIVEWGSFAGAGAHLWISQPQPFGAGEGCLYANLIDVDGTFHPFTSPAEVTTTNVYQHIALTYDYTSGVAVIYVNGTSVAQENLGPFIPQTSTDLYLGCRPTGAPDLWTGQMDEVSVYDRALQSFEVKAIYAAGTNGKCAALVPPVILVQPTNQAVSANTSVEFAVYAVGAPPLAYQWQFNSTNLIGASAATLLISNAQVAQSGVYAVVVTNLQGAVTSSNAVLTVDGRSCVPTPAGMIGWWRGEGDAADAINSFSGTLTGGVAFAAGKVGQAFDLNPFGSYITVPDNEVWTFGTNNFSIELWARFNSLEPSSYSVPSAPLVAQDEGHFNAAKWWFAFGGLNLSFHVNGPTVGPQFPLVIPFVPEIGQWYHLALVRNGNNVTIYTNGLPAGSATTSVAIPNVNVPVTIGQAEDCRFTNGVLDEVSIYGRALSPAEVTAIYNADSLGKCLGPSAPWIHSQPKSTNQMAGTNLTFAVSTVGSVPVSYQWRFNGTEIVGATASKLTVTNIQYYSAGNYSVQVSNVAGVMVSSNALLSVQYPPPVVRFRTNTVVGGEIVTVPVTISANGFENTVAFSLNYNTQRVTFASATLGAGAAGATMLLNTSMVETGRVGIAVTFPPQSAFAFGTQEVVRVTFNTLPLLGSTTVTNVIAFADQPLAREVVDPLLAPVTAYYSNGAVIVNPTVLEADVFPRTSGNQNLSVTDWLQVGRFVARLDVPAGTNEFQRADCAPVGSAGDGQLKATDWVQAGRYVSGSDLGRPIGGPIASVPPTHGNGSNLIKVEDYSVIVGENMSLPILINQSGLGNAVSFTLNFDPVQFTYKSCSLAGVYADGSLLLNTNTVAAGKLGVAFAMSPGTPISVGVIAFMSVNFGVAPTATGSPVLSLTDDIVPRCLSDVNAFEMGATWSSGAISLIVPAPPTLTITRVATNVVLSWPAVPTGYSLQSTLSLGNGQTAWTNLPSQPQTNGESLNVTLPITNLTRWFRLSR